MLLCRQPLQLQRSLPGRSRLLWQLLRTGQSATGGVPRLQSSMPAIGIWWQTARAVRLLRWQSRSARWLQAHFDPEQMLHMAAAALIKLRQIFCWCRLRCWSSRYAQCF